MGCGAAAVGVFWADFVAILPGVRQRLISYMLLFLFLEKWSCPTTPGWVPSQKSLLANVCDSLSPFVYFFSVHYLLASFCYFS